MANSGHITHNNHGIRSNAAAIYNILLLFYHHLPPINVYLELSPLFSEKQICCLRQIGNGK